MVFWILTAAIALVTALTLAAVLLRRHGDTTPTAAYDMRVYRDQLKGVERDLARGVIAPEDAERIRVEVSRRLLAADARTRDTGREATAARPLTYAVAGLVGIALTGGSLLLYGELGAPGYGDLSRKQRIAMAETARETRPSQQEAESEVAKLPTDPEMLPPSAPEGYMDLVEKLREAVASRPDDLRGQMLLARNEAALGNMAAARKAQEQVLRLKGDEATQQDRLDYAGILIQSARGYVSPEAEAVLAQVLEENEANPMARYYWGLMLTQTGRPDIAFRIWNDLLREGPRDAPWISPIRDQIEEVALRAGANFSPPPETAAPGPSGADIEAAGELDPEEQQAMVRSMVEGLAERLADQGGSAQEWARLIGTLSVLGESGRAGQALADARAALADDEAGLAEVEAAARAAGLAEPAP